MRSGGFPQTRTVQAAGAPLRRRRSRHHGGRVAASARGPPKPGAWAQATVGPALGQGPRLLVRGWERAALHGPWDSGGPGCGSRPSAAGNRLRAQRGSMQTGSARAPSVKRPLGLRGGVVLLSGCCALAGT